MPASIGVNLRVTGHCSQGGRKYMEDLFSVAYQQTEDERDLEYAFFGIYDGHGGSEAAAFAKEHLMDSIVKQRQFWSDDDEDVLKAIRNGYMLTHLNMWKELEKWPKTITGLPSTAGTTASVAFIRRGKIYVGHVGDSAIVLGYQKDGSEDWAAKSLTCDHKPESVAEMDRIQRCGGKVVSKAGVPRVVWNRPRPGHKGPIKKNTPMDEIPFLAVARSLGDLWSYNSQNDEFVVSPDPDVGVLTIDPSKFRCLIFGTDGLWNMISPEGAVSLVQATERHNEAALVGSNGGQPRDWLNPSKSLVDHALERWSNTRMRADNTSVVTLMLDPPGPPRATVLRSRGAAAPRPAPPPAAPAAPAPRADPPVPENGLTIMTRYSDTERAPHVPAPAPTPAPTPALPPCASIDGRFSLGPTDDTPLTDESDTITNYGNPSESYFMARLLNRNRIINTLSEVFAEIVDEVQENPVREPSPVPQTVVPEPPTSPANPETAVDSATTSEDGGIQINEVSSSSPTECPGKGRGRKPKNEPKKEAEASQRVLRSHEPEPQRIQTRQASRRPPPPPPADRVVILSRGRAAPAPEPVPTVPRVTRSRDPPAPPKTTRAASNPPPAGNLHGAATPTGPGGRVRRRAERPPAADCCKENCRRRAAAPPPRRRPRLEEPEVHSTTPDQPCARLAGVPAAPPPPPRALRSRNDAGEAAPPPLPLKRRAGDEARVLKVRSTAARSLARRETGPWAPALALRNRLRKRLAK